MVVKSLDVVKGRKGPKPGDGVRAKVARKRREDRVVQQDMNQKPIIRNGRRKMIHNLRLTHHHLACPVGYALSVKRDHPHITSTHLLKSA